MEKLRQKILQFVHSPKDVPLLAGFSIGIYMLLYYYNSNLALANSWVRLGFFTVFYVLLPMAGLYIGFKLFGWLKKGKWQKHFLFVAIPGTLAFYLLQLSLLGYYKRFIFAGVVLAALLLSLKAAKYYKAFIVIILFMALFNLPNLAYTGYAAATMGLDWKKQPDDIEDIVLKSKPNIYYLQPDGYASFNNLKQEPYSYEGVSDAQNYLKEKGFVTYDDFRSNYYSTLLSNSSMFSMKHHYTPQNLEDLFARGIIMGDNPVLRILKKNGYKTHFISEKPYLLVNRPSLGYDDTNFSGFELFYNRDAWSIEVNEEQDFVNALHKNQDKQGNFYFLERMVPTHIANTKQFSMGAKAERKLYLDRLEDANRWIKFVVGHIERQDPGAIIIITADHGGFVGFDYTGESHYKTTNPALVKSMFGAMAAIKWNNPSYNEYDAGLKTSVNLFRTVFSFLAQDKKYLKHLQEDASYLNLTEPNGVHRLIDANGRVVFQKK